MSYKLKTWSTKRRNKFRHCMCTARFKSDLLDGSFMMTFSLSLLWDRGRSSDILYVLLAISGSRLPAVSRVCPRHSAISYRGFFQWSFSHYRLGYLTDLLEHLFGLQLKKWSKPLEGSKQTRSQTNQLIERPSVNTWEGRSSWKVHIWQTKYSTPFLGMCLYSWVYNLRLQASGTTTSLG